MKKIIFLLIIISFVFIIYFFTRDNKQYIVVLGDYVCKNNNLNTSILNKKGNNVENYVNNCHNIVKISDFIHNIEKNKKIIYKNRIYTINNLLIKADTIIISIGMNDLLSYNNQTNMYSYIDTVMIDMDNLLSLLRYYSKEKIYVYNYFGLNEPYLKYVNNRLEQFVKEYNIDIIDISYIKKNKITDNEYNILIHNTLKKV